MSCVSSGSNRFSGATSSSRGGRSEQTTGCRRRGPRRRGGRNPRRARGSRQALLPGTGRRGVVVDEPRHDHRIDGGGRAARWRRWWRSSPAVAGDDELPVPPPRRGGPRPDEPFVVLPRVAAARVEHVRPRGPLLAGTRSRARSRRSATGGAETVVGRRADDRHPLRRDAEPRDELLADRGARGPGGRPPSGRVRGGSGSGGAQRCRRAPVGVARRDEVVDGGREGQVASVGLLARCADVDGKIERRKGVEDAGVGPDASGAPR